MATKTKNVHTPAQREFIVRKLAAFEPPRAISVAFAAMYPDVACDDNDISAIDPKNNIVSPELHALWRAERLRVVEDPDSAPFAAQKARLIVLSNHVADCVDRNDWANARLALRQIAEEQGLVGGKGVKPLPVADEAAKKVTAIQRTIVDPALEPAASEG